MAITRIVGLGLVVAAAFAAASGAAADDRRSKDTARGQTQGEALKGFGGPFCTASLATKPCAWYALSPTGAPVTKTR